MIILNLTNKKTSEIKYEVFSFPDGQQDILLTNLNNYFELRNYGFGEVLRCDSVQIRSRFNNFKDLELILCATKVLRSYGVKEIHLYIPYLLGAINPVKIFFQFFKTFTKYTMCTYKKFLPFMPI